jgi:hypothetical protein
MAPGTTSYISVVTVRPQRYLHSAQALSTRLARQSRRLNRRHRQHSRLRCLPTFIPLQQDQLRLSPEDRQAVRVPMSPSIGPVEIQGRLVSQAIPRPGTPNRLPLPIMLVKDTFQLFRRQVAGQSLLHIQPRQQSRSPRLPNRPLGRQERVSNTLTPG